MDRSAVWGTEALGKADGAFWTRYGYPLTGEEKTEEIPARIVAAAGSMARVITTFFYPEGRHFPFDEMYRYIKERGYAIYPGKVTDADTFRIGNIGEIYPEDIDRVCGIMKEFLEAHCQKEG